MSHYLLSLNQAKRQTISFFMIICFAMYNAWQMGFIYFMNPSLSVTGRTPLPISMDNVTTLMSMGYVFAIAYMIILPHFVIWAERISTMISLTTILMMFLPLTEPVMLTTVYVHIFCCCFMIGFETFIMINFFSEESIIKHLTLGYGVAVCIVALVQNELLPITFSSFRLVVVILLVLLLIFTFKMSATKDVCPVYVKKSDKLIMPKHLFSGIFALAFVSCLLMLCGPAAVGEVPHGVSLAYFADAVGSLIMYVCYKKNNFNPLRIVSILMNVSAIGYLTLFLSNFTPILKYPACILIGLGFAPCQMLPLYGMTLMKAYPSKYICPSIIGIAVITVVIQSFITGIFGSTPNMLHLVYMAIMVFLTLIYNQWEPYLVHTLVRKVPAVKQTVTTVSASQGMKSGEDISGLLSTLTKREREVLDLIGCGYTNNDIAKILIISEHTVNDYTKKIYRKLDVHSRHAAARIINQYENKKSDII